MEVLLRRWHEVAPDDRRRVIGGARHRMGGALARLAGHPTDRFARTDAARLARLTPLPEAIEAAGTLLADADPVVADAARETLAHLADHAPTLRPHQQDALAGVLMSHAQAGRRSACELLERLGPFWSARVRAWLAEADEATLLRMRAMVRKAADRQALARAVGWLGLPGCAPGALASIVEAKHAPRIARALRASHLLLSPHRRAALQRDPRAAALARAWTPDHDAPEDARLGRLRWLALADPTALQAALGAAPLDPSPRLRLAALRLIRSRARGAGALLDLAFDAEAPVARSATLALFDRADDDARAALESLRRSPHAGVRRIAAPTPRRRWETMIDIRRRLDDSPDVMLADLRGRIAAGEAPSRIGAIGLARRLRLTERVETEILTAAQDADARVAATATVALGALWTASARAALALAMTHRDPRVRASAIETIARRDPVAAAVGRALHDDHARTRANAIRARLAASAEAAVDHLEAMLCDDRPEHRRSALWVAERLVVRPMADRVARLVVREVDPVVRRRAESCARRLAAAGGAR